VNVWDHGESFRILTTSFWSHSVNFFVCQKSAAHNAQQAPAARKIKANLFINDLISCFVGRAILPAAAFQAAGPARKPVRGQDWPPHCERQKLQRTAH
jgi:hypothetical protein